MSLRRPATVCLSRICCPSKSVVTLFCLRGNVFTEQFPSYVHLWLHDLYFQASCHSFKFHKGWFIGSKVDRREATKRHRQTSWRSHKPTLIFFKIRKTSCISIFVLYYCEKFKRRLCSYFLLSLLISDRKEKGAQNFSSTFRFIYRMSG
jgi:hypothetical protein